MSARHDIELMQHADGELEGEPGIADEIARDPIARAKVEAIGQLGELVRGHLELSADRVADKRFDAMWREIEKGVDREASAEPTKAVALPTSFWKRTMRWFDRHRGHIVTGIVSAGAVAALAMFLRTQPGTDTPGRDPLRVQPAAYHPAEVEALDTPGGTGTVFNLQDEDGNATVIWVTPEDTVEGI
ncbi:MAG: hypothetical protein JWO36_3900 [Myxococcales bacterium]|nr:hypothetical protein [Myxococcales bacterium]